VSLGEKTMAISDRRKREKVQRRQAIIDAAESLFFLRGYDNVSMNDIAEEVELNRATIYLYFENKEALYFAVVLRGVRLLNKMIKSNVETTADAQKIDAILKAYATFFKLYPQYSQVYNFFQSGRFISPILNRYQYSGGDAGEIIKLQKEIFNILHLTIKNGIKEGRIPINMDPLYATFLVMTLVDTMLNPSPSLQKELRDRNINKSQFDMDFMDFIKQLIKNR
jgi:TetR/AcrR family transcriptional regulator